MFRAAHPALDATGHTSRGTGLSGAFQANEREPCDGHRAAVIMLGLVRRTGAKVLVVSLGYWRESSSTWTQQTPPPSRISPSSEGWRLGRRPGVDSDSSRARRVAMSAAGTGEARSSTRTERTVLVTGVAAGLIGLPAVWCLRGTQPERACQGSKRTDQRG